MTSLSRGCVLPYFLLFALAATMGRTWAQVSIPSISNPVYYANEHQDWRVAPTSETRLTQVHARTPRTIPGARVIATMELKALLEVNMTVLVIDVLDSSTRSTVPGAYWMWGAGNGRFQANEKLRFAQALEKITDGDKSRPIVILCSGPECWLSYNACLHAVAAGYTDILWYRGGTDAWTGAGLNRRTPRRIDWQSGAF